MFHLFPIITQISSSSMSSYISLIAKKALIISAFLFITSTIFAQSPPNIAILPVANTTEISSADKLSEIAEMNIISQVSQLKDYTFIDARENQTKYISLYLLKKEAKKRDCDYIIYGKISGAGPFTLSLFLYERVSHRILFQETGAMQRDSEISYLSDGLIQTLLKKLTEAKTKQGKLKIVNKGVPRLFVVTIDNIESEANTSSFLLSEGEYNIIIEAFYGKKKREIYSNRIAIKANEQTLVEIVIPGNFDTTTKDEKESKKKETKYTRLEYIDKSSAILRFTVGALISSAIDSETFQPVALGDALLFKVNFSTSGLSGIGFTGGIQFGVMGVWKAAGAYEYTPGFLPDTSFSGYYKTITPTSGFSIGGEAGPYFRFSERFGMYPVLSFDLVSAVTESPNNDYASPFPSPQFGLFGVRIGFDVFIGEHIPVTLELGIALGTIEFLSNTYTNRIGLTIAVGMGYDW